MILYKNTKAMVCLTDSDTDTKPFDILLLEFCNEIH